MDKSVTRVTVWHHSAEPRDAKTITSWDRCPQSYLTLMCQILIFNMNFRTAQSETNSSGYLKVVNSL